MFEIILFEFSGLTNFPPAVETLKLLRISCVSLSKDVKEEQYERMAERKNYTQRKFLKPAIMQSHDCTNFLRICANFGKNKLIPGTN